MVIGVGVLATPSYRQRIYSGKDVSSVRRSFVYTGVLYLFFSVLPAIIGMANHPEATGQAEFARQHPAHARREGNRKVMHNPDPCAPTDRLHLDRDRIRGQPRRIRPAARQQGRQIIQLGIGKCGHCKVGSHYMCVDGPVFTYEEMLQLPPEF